MFDELSEINKRPIPFEYYTAADLWTDEHISKKMLEYHLDGSNDLSSRNLDFINRSADWISNHFKLSTKSEMIDFGCGPGLYTIRFARKGIGVTGVDFSKRSIEYAKQEALKENLDICYIEKNYLEFEPTKKYDLITMIMCDFCVLSPEQRKIILRIFRDSLKPDGSILMDVYSLKSFEKREERAVYELNQISNFWSPDDYYTFINTFKYDSDKVILDKYTIIERSRTRIICNWLQFFSVESIKKEFEENGLTVVEVYSDVSGSDHKEEDLEFAIVAKLKQQ